MALIQIEIIVVTGLEIIWIEWMNHDFRIKFGNSLKPAPNPFGHMTTIINHHAYPYRIPGPISRN